MGTPFMAEVKLVSFSFAPKSWALCNGQFLPINQNQALFSLLGTTYGGNGQTTFALPDLRGRVPIHFGGGHSLGEAAGQEFHTVTQSEMPQHIHPLNAANVLPTTDVPDTSVQLSQASIEIYRAVSSLGAMDPGTVSSVGGSQPHENRQPYLVLNYCIALQGVFPSHN